MKRAGLLIFGVVVLMPAVAQACAYHAAFANLTFGKFVIMLLNYFQASAQAQMAAAAEGIRTGQHLGPLFVALGFGFGYGALHALGPGHGKLVISSYFLANGGKIREGVWMGTQIALIHVASAIVIVMAAQLVLTSLAVSGADQYRPVRLVSYAAIATIGIYMLWTAAKKWIAHRKHKAHAHTHHHANDHAHDHGGCSCALHQTDANGITKRRSLISLMVGVVPCTGAVLVMLFALANDMVFMGVLVVLAISVGMAATMASLGIASVWLRRSVLEKSGANSGVMAINFELLGGFLIFGIGAVLFSFTI